MEWLLSHVGGSPPPATADLSGTFSLQVSDVIGNPAFLFQAQPYTIFTVVLDATNPLAGSLVQIRELAGGTGRIVFRAVQNESGNIAGSWSINRTTNLVDLRLTYNGSEYRFSLTVTELVKINRSLYIKSALDPAAVDPCAADKVAPDISLSAAPARLWPPNHEMVRVATGISSTDNSGAAPNLSVTVTSSEPDNGLGDGDTANDVNVVDNGNGTFDVWVRAERSGKGTGRVYTITATSTDACGNTATKQAQVTVPKNNSTK